MKAPKPLVAGAKDRAPIEPNAVAIRYQRDVARALDIVQGASMSVVVNPKVGTLSLAVLPTFATRWLGPRLGESLTSHPCISVNTSTRIGRVDFTGETFDTAIYYGLGDWDGATHLRLLDERVTACVSPEFAKRQPFETLEDLAGIPKLQLESLPKV